MALLGQSTIVTLGDPAMRFLLTAQPNASAALPSCLSGLMIPAVNARARLSQPGRQRRAISDGRDDAGAAGPPSATGASGSTRGSRS